MAPSERSPLEIPTHCVVEDSDGTTKLKGSKNRGASQWDVKENIACRINVLCPMLALAAKLNLFKFFRSTTSPVCCRSTRRALPRKPRNLSWAPRWCGHGVNQSSQSPESKKKNLSFFHRSTPRQFVAIFGRARLRSSGRQLKLSEMQKQIMMPRRRMFAAAGQSHGFETFHFLVPLLVQVKESWPSPAYSSSER